MPRFCLILEPVYERELFKVIKGRVVKDYIKLNIKT
jgi:hypothetical protein